MKPARLKNVGELLSYSEGVASIRRIFRTSEAAVSSASELSRALDAGVDDAALTILRGDSRMTVKVPRSGGAR